MEISKKLYRDKKTTQKKDNKMNHTITKELLLQSLQLEKELCSLIKECLREIFEGELWVIYEFEQDVEVGMEINGCLRGLGCYKELVKDAVKRRLEREAKKS